LPGEVRVGQDVDAFLQASIDSYHLLLNLQRCPELLAGALRSLNSPSESLFSRLHPSVLQSIYHRRHSVAYLLAI
jgi:hypothetical protein